MNHLTEEELKQRAIKIFPYQDGNLEDDIEAAKRRIWVEGAKYYKNHIQNPDGPQPRNQEGKPFVPPIETEDNLKDILEWTGWVYVPLIGLFVWNELDHNWGIFAYQIICWVALASVSSVWIILNWIA